MKVIIKGEITFDAKDCWQVRDSLCGLFVLTEPVTGRYVESNDDRWALVRLAKELRPGWPVLLSDEDGTRVVGAPA